MRPSTERVKSEHGQAQQKDHIHWRDKDIIIITFPVPWFYLDCRLVTRGEGREFELMALCVYLSKIDRVIWYDRR